MGSRIAHQGHTAPRNLARLFLLAVVALLLVSLLQSCQPVEPEYYTHGACSLCDGTGQFGEHSCPSCRGLGIVRYSYPVIEPTK